jgi:superfamily I DNA/RNA helicase
MSDTAREHTRLRRPHRAYGKTLKTSPEVLAKYQNLFQYIMVDDIRYDDCSTLISMLASIESFVIGDDYQSIYGWRQADIRVFSISKIYGCGGDHA